MSSAAVVERLAAGAPLRDWLAVHNAVMPQLAQDEADALYHERLDPTLVRFVAHLDGEPVGAASAGRCFFLGPDADVLAGGVWVLPRARRRGLGSALLEAVRSEAGARGRRWLEGQASADDPGGMRFFGARGFGERDRSSYMALDLATAAVARPRWPDGLCVVSLEERPELGEAVYAVAREAISDVPEDDPMDAGRYADWRAFWVDPPSLPAAGFLLALTDPGDDVVAYASLALPGARPGIGVHTMTGVARSWRNRGVGEALKRELIGWAQERGLRSLESENADRNTPIRTINERLGYVPLSVHVWLHGPVDASPAIR